MQNRRMHSCILVFCVFVGLPNTLASQTTAIMHARVIDGSGTPAMGDRTILIEGTSSRQWQAPTSSCLRVLA